MKRYIFLLLLLPIVIHGQFAFPSALGFGRNATGGRGGAIIHVTNLNDSGPGSFREAIETNGPRIIVFDVGGDIEITSLINIGVGTNSGASVATNALREDVTIAGETAPFPGITIRAGATDANDFGALLKVQVSNVIIRNIRFRVDDGVISSMDALHVVNPWDELGTYTIENVIIDHVSMSNGSDENFSTQGTLNMTVQNSMLTDNDTFRTFLFGENNFNFSFIGNYMSHTDDRNVLVGYGTSGETSEFINNITYGYESGMAVVWGNNTDVLGNIYKAFINNTPRNYAIAWTANSINHPGALVTDGSFYFADNFQLNPHEYNLYNPDAISNNSATRVITNSLIPTWETTISGIEQRVFSGVGNSLHRDAMDTQAIADYTNNTGSFNSLTVPNLTPTSRNMTVEDSDNDDMLDEAEIAIWGDITTTNLPNASTNGTQITNFNPWTNIEKTFFYLAGEVIAGTPEPLPPIFSSKAVQKKKYVPWN